MSVSRTYYFKLSLKSVWFSALYEINVNFDALLPEGLIDSVTVKENQNESTYH